MYKDNEEKVLSVGYEREEEYCLNKGLTVGELIEKLQELPKDVKVKGWHFYRVGQAVRNRSVDITDITPCFNADTGKLECFTLGIDIRYDEI